MSFGAILSVIGGLGQIAGAAGTINNVLIPQETKDKEAQQNYIRNEKLKLDAQSQLINDQTSLRIKQAKAEKRIQDILTGKGKSNYDVCGLSLNT